MSFIPCPCCGEFSRIEGDLTGFCPVCGWKYDVNQEKDPTLEKGKNPTSLKKMQEIYFRHKLDRRLF